MKLNDHLSRLSETWLRRHIAWLGGALIAVVAVLAAHDGWRSYRETLAQTGRELDVQARVIAEQTTRSLQAVDTVLRHLAEQHQRGLLQRLNPEELHAYLKEQAVGLVQVNGISIFGPDGRGLGSSIVPPPQVRQLDLNRLETYHRLREEPQVRMMVDTTIRSFANGRWVIPMGRRLEGPDGEFLGAVGASGRLDYFQQFYRDAYPEANTRIALLHRNSTLLARHPPDEAALGRKFPPLGELIDKAASGATVSRNISPLDGVDRFTAVRVVPDHPLVVMVTRDASAVLGPWRAQAIGSALRTLALGAMAVFLIMLATRQLARLKNAGDSLAVSEQRYALAAAGSDVGVWDWDLAAGTAYESRRARELQGLPLEPETQPLDELRGMLTVHPDDARSRASALQAHLDGARPHYEADYRVKRADGRYYWIHVRALCTRNAAGEPLRIAGSVADVDNRKRAEEALRESEERYALAMAGLSGGHWVWNTATDALFVSDKISELMGLPADQPRATTRTAFFAGIELHPDDRERFRAVSADLTEGRLQRADYEYRIILPPPQGERWILTRAQRFEGRDGGDLRVAGVTVDITERKQAERERQRLEDQLRQAQKLEAIGTLAGGIAHDFNNILSAILGYGELAQKGAPEGTPLRRHIDASIAAGQRAKSLVERILAFSRSGMGERMPVHVQSVVDEALDAVAASLPPTVALTRTLEAGDAGVLGDPTQIHQVVMNLCANAVQAMNLHGRLDVVLDVIVLTEPLSVATSTLPAGDCLRLSIADTGSGIAPELLERIFDPFFTTKEVGVGTGLGLSLVHGIVTDLGGGIEVDSRVGEGSRFSVYLPTRATVTAPAAAAPGTAERGEGQTVLVVDDEEALVRLAEEALAELGYEPVGFTSSAAALEALRAKTLRFDLLLTDEAMPGMTGSDLARAARELWPNLPIVMASGFVTPTLRERARAAGVAEVLSKPLAVAELARALAGALRGLQTTVK